MTGPEDSFWRCSYKFLSKKTVRHLVDETIDPAWYIDTVAVLKIISVKNSRAWVSMVSYLEKQRKIKV